MRNNKSLGWCDLYKPIKCRFISYFFSLRSSCKEECYPASVSTDDVRRLSPLHHWWLIIIIKQKENHFTHNMLLFFFVKFSFSHFCKNFSNDSMDNSRQFSSCLCKSHYIYSNQFRLKRKLLFAFIFNYVSQFKINKFCAKCKGHQAIMNPCFFLAFSL